MIQLLLALLALLGNCGWLISGRKYRQEVRSLKADAEQKEFDLSRQYVNEFKQNIYEPLQQEVRLLRQAIEAVHDCPLADDCPVADRLHDPPPASGHRGNHV